MEIYGSSPPNNMAASQYNFSRNFDFIKEEKIEDLKANSSTAYFDEVGKAVAKAVSSKEEDDLVVCKVEKFTGCDDGEKFNDSDDEEPDDSQGELVLQDEVVHSTERRMGRGGAMKKPLKDKTCLVCGDRALGYNFNAVTCESCKAFFRRNAFRNIWGRCEGHCEISIESRSYCKRCRLKKCFAIGMKRDLILNERQKEERRQKICDNRARRNSGGMGMSPNRMPQTQAGVGTPAYQTQLSAPINLTDSSSQDALSQPSGTDCVPTGSPVASPLACTSSSPPPVATGSRGVSSAAPTVNPGAHPAASMHPAMGMGMSMMHGLGSMSIDPMSQSHVIAGEIPESRYTGLKEPEQSLLRHVVKAFHISFDAPVPDSLVQAPSNAEFLNMADISVRRMVKMSKHLPRFKTLDAEDQVILLKGAVLEVLVLRSVKIYDPKSQNWTLQNKGTFKITADKMQAMNSESIKFMQQYQGFARSVMMSIRRDNIILMLLMVLTVFSSDRSGLINKDLVSEAQEEYASLLKEYIRVTYPRDRVMFARVLQKLADIRDLHEVHSMMLQNATLNDLEPLIMEIFDLSTQKS